MFLSDADYTGTFEVVVFGGTIGGDAVQRGRSASTLAGRRVAAITVALPTNGDQFFYLEVHEPSPDRMAWSAPIWISKI